MATRPVPEPLNGGLVTARDQCTLEAGELVRADNAVYFPNDHSIHKVRGRTKYNTVALGAAGVVKGLRFLEFDAGNSYLLAHEASSLYLSALADETGTFATTIASVGTGATLDAVHHGNRYVALIGDTSNRLINPDTSSRQHGLAPVTRLPTAAEAGAPAIVAGSFNSELGTGFFHFITTEIVEDGQNPAIESTYTGNPATATSALTTPSSQAYSITKPATVNANATKWAVYMSQFPTTNPTPTPNLNTFRFVGDADIANTTITVGNAAGSTGLFPTADTTIVAGWSTPSAAYTDNGTGTRNSVDGATQDYRVFRNGAIDFPTSLSGTVKGIEVFIKFRIPDYNILKRIPKISISLSPDNGATFFPTGAISFFATDTPGAVAAYQLVSVGSATNQWGRTWALGDFTDANFRVRLKYAIKNNFTAATGNAIADIDYLQVKVYTTTTTPSVNVLGRSFRTVNVSVAGITSTYGADGQPPVASTGDMFEGQMVLNDVQDQSIIRYSLPEFVESFPSIYFLNFETKVQDFVTCIRRLGNKLVVGLKQQLYRINYLPRETDAEFDRGRAYEAISETEGIVGTQASCLFSPDGGALLLAYISHAGPRYTDGFQSFSLTDDLNWGATVRLPVSGDATNYLANCVLVNYAVLQQIWLYYTPPGQTTNTKALVFHYNKAHRKQGGTYKVTGPIDVSALSATAGRLAGNEILLTGQSGGFAYVEDRGFTHNAGGTIPFLVRTREMYPAGLGRTAIVESLFVRHLPDAPVGTVTVTPLTRFKDESTVTQAIKTFDTTNEGAARLFFHHNFESIRWQFSEPGANGGDAVRLSGLVMDIAETGLPERRP